MSMDNTISPKVEQLLASRDVISNDSLPWIRLWLGYIPHFIIAPLALCTNIINLIVFRKIGIKDSVTVSFFALSTAHVGSILFYGVGRVIFLCNNVLFIETEVDLSGLAYLVHYYSNWFEDVAGGIIVFTAVQKCCCVAIPFHFKDIFTRARSVIITVAIYLSSLAYYMPVLTGQWLQSTFNSQTNKSQIVFTSSQAVQVHNTISHVINGLVLPVLSQALVLVCLIILTIKLKQAAKFRTSSARNGVNNKTKTNSTNSSNHNALNTLQNGRKSKKNNGNDMKRNNLPVKTNGLGGKELKVIQAVYVTAILFAACNIGEIPVQFVGFLFPEYDGRRGRQYYNTYVLVTSFQRILTNVEATCHIFIYIKFNHKFRLVFEKIFRK